MKYLYSAYSFFIIILLLVQCTTVKEIAKTTQPDYNRRVTIQDARYEHKLSFVGASTLALSTVGGAFALRTYPLVLTADSEGRINDNKNLNTVIGGIAGFGIGSLAAYKFAHVGKQELVIGRSEKQAWLKKFNPKLIELPPYDTSNIMRAIDRRVEPDFVVRAVSDGLDFMAAFPNSSRKNYVFDESIKIAQSKNELFGVMTACPNCSGIAAAQVKCSVLLENPGKIDQDFAAGENQNLRQRVGNKERFLKIHEKVKIESFSYKQAKFFYPYRESDLQRCRWSGAVTADSMATGEGTLYFQNAYGTEMSLVGKLDRGRLEQEIKFIVYNRDKYPVRGSLRTHVGKFEKGLAQGPHIYESFVFANVGAPQYFLYYYKYNKPDRTKDHFIFYEDGSKVKMRDDDGDGILEGQIRVGKDWFAAILKCTASAVGSSFADDPLSQALISEAIEAYFDERDFEIANLPASAYKNAMIKAVEKNGNKNLARAIKIFDLMYCIYTD